MKTFRIAALLISGIALLPAARAQTFLEIRQNQTLYNLQSRTGVPIGQVVGTPPGSDGRQPTVSQQNTAGLTVNPATPKQFQSLVSFGALASPSQAKVSLLNTANSLIANGPTIGLPSGVGGPITYVLSSAKVGAPFLSRQLDFLFGSVIPVPETDIVGALLPPQIQKENYWLPEPFTTNNHAGARYYFSPHASRVYAIQPGPIDVTWKRAVPFTTQPADYVANPSKYQKDGNNYYPLFVKHYIVSGSAVKEPRQLYWTEKSFSRTGKPVQVPSTLVDAVQVVYNSGFPERVTNEFRPLGEVPLIPNGTNQLEETRTLWFDKQQNFINAYNAEGRAFVEFLGDKVSGENRKQLGFEIVDVIRQPNPNDIRIDLGEKITPYQDQEDLTLYPEPIETGTGAQFLFRKAAAIGAERPDIYAIRETHNLNDVQVLWQIKGILDLKWPFLLGRYQFGWPADVSRYSHYVRPLVATEPEALATAISLPAENVPQIDYQDPFDVPRAKLTPDFKFYTFLNTAFPAHRTLLRFTAGDGVRFERVFSWLDTNLKNNSFLSTVATNLTAWHTNDSQLHLPDNLTAPRVVSQTAFVGQRLVAPALEFGNVAADGYVAGYVNQLIGTSYSVSAYIDPFVKGFDEANAGAIIPINAVPTAAVPNKNKLEILWFRSNGIDASSGFKPVLWPSALGRYTLEWPPAPDEIILASNDGSGGLPSLQAKGHIYFQNDPLSQGYNPNEEHALMIGGQAYALRDDLNVLTGAGYSSAPAVLLEYTEADGRPAMHVFNVRRESPENGITFTYQITAGSVMQPPMPLPLLDKPFAPKIAGVALKNLNTEVSDWTVSSSTVATAGGLPTSTLNLSTKPIFPDYRRFALQSGPVVRWILVTSVDPLQNKAAGVISSSLPFDTGEWTISAQPSNANQWKYAVTGDPSGLSNKIVLLAATSQRASWTGTITETGAESGINFAVVDFGSARPSAAQTANLLVNPLSVAAGDFNSWKISSEPLPANIADDTTRAAYSKFTFQDRKGDRWVYRGPHTDSGQPALFAQFYYRTMPGFYFPGQAQPPLGTITPYLRAKLDTGAYVGDPVKGNFDGDQVGDGNPLGITYEPVWPESVPTLQMAETLMVPKRGLPAVRGQTSLSVFYQQSIAMSGEANRSTILHDPTREKVFELGADKDSTTLLGKIPDSIRTSTSRGKTFFPNLPPHLVDRFFFDSNRGQHGAIVFKGQFFDEPVGERFALLNVAGVKDLATLQGLCLSTDPVHDAWNAAVAGMKTKMEEFQENPAKPGTFIALQNPAVKMTADIAEVSNENIAVDSYALSAVGPGTGYVTLIAGNGLAFTPIADPVSVQIIKVVKDLYRGEVKIVQSSNPLSEKLTLQQVADLAGKIDQYEFDWRIAAPVDGVPPLVNQNTPRVLLASDTWAHIHYLLPLDVPGAVHKTPIDRVDHDVSTTVVTVSSLDLLPTMPTDNKFDFLVLTGHRLVPGNLVVLRNAEGDTVNGTVIAGTTPTRLLVKIDDGQTVSSTFIAVGLDERLLPNQPQSIVFRTFTVPEGVPYSDLWLSLNLDPALGAKVYLDGQPIVTANIGLNDTTPSTAPGDLLPLDTAYRLEAGLLAAGTPDGHGNVVHHIAVELFSSALPNVLQTFDLRIEAHESLDLAAAAGSQWLPLDPAKFQDGVRAVIGEGADIRSLADNYLIMRYRAKFSNHASYVAGAGWSRWTEPQLAEGWIKRVLAGINPFNQRVTDLFNNRVNTDANILTTAGRRWEGDVALNLDAINGYGLIEIYETILRRGRLLSIDAGINYGPANDALLLAAGYLNDLYMLVGNEAWADAANPTIAVGSTLADVATALFAFKGQVPSLLDEELALLRGRDDFMQPGVETAPAYNRLYWNYTRGIDAGEVVYSLNYNIQPDPTKPPTGAITAADAQHMFPQGHGDAYGHYLTAAKGYYSLLMSPDFSWVPRSEAVTILGKPVQVDYQDERKFAAAAAAIARAGKQILDLSWRSDYVPGRGNGWSHLSPTRVNSTRQNPVTRYWGTDHWASRVAEGSYLNWVVGNSLLPAVDPDPSHEGIQKIDRTTVPELRELPALGESVQVTLDNAEGGLSPLGLPEDAVAFDINPNRITGSAPVTHFEQVFERAYQTLVNASASFNDAKDVTKAMRSQQDTLTDFQTGVDKQELAYQNQLIELYGTPYTDDIGPGRTYVQGYTGPDLVHYMYVENTDLTGTKLQDPQQTFNFKLDVQQLPSDWWDGLTTTFNFALKRGDTDYSSGDEYIPYALGPRGFADKPTVWTGRRASPGALQQSIADYLTAHDNVRLALIDVEDQKRTLDKQVEVFDAKVEARENIFLLKGLNFTATTIWDSIKTGLDIQSKVLGYVSSVVSKKAVIIGDSIPKIIIAGVAVGTDAPGTIASETVKGVADIASDTFESAILGIETFSKITSQIVEKATKLLETFAIPQLEWDRDLKEATSKLGDTLYAERLKLENLNLKLRALEAAERKYRADVAKGDRVQAERETFRLRAAAVIQGYRTRDAAFRIFRNEKLERYKSLFDLASQYSLLAANAYDYETGLLNTPEGKGFVHRIISSRALGVVKDGAPQFAGSDTGDPGLSSALAEMKADWDVLKGRLGFNNPDSYGTTVSLRTENLRILSGADGDQKWRDMLEKSRMANLLDDPDVRRYCLQIDPGGGLPVPGLVITFSTTIADFYNFFGKQLAGGDHAFSPSSFATKIYALGVALEGYKGMDDPGATTTTTSTTGSTTPSDPTAPFLNTDTLAATPYVYLVPVGTDSMRSPPLGDQSDIRSWNVFDVSIPLPFNIGASDFSTKELWQSSQSLTEPLFSERKHQAFRPVSSAKSFPNAGAVFQRTQFMNARLIGRSVWNSQWKLIIPGQTLLNNPDEGLDRFLRTVKDVKLNFQTYSYSGN